jgi:hypothetical protein
MPNKKINHSILKKRHSGDNNPIIHHYQMYQNKEFVMEKKGRGIHIGSLMDFSASSTGYNEKKRTEETQIIHQRKPDTLRKYMPPPKVNSEKNPHHLFRPNGFRSGLPHIVNN